MKHAISYLNTLSLMLEARKHGNEVREDLFLDELDIIWPKLSKREVSLINRISMYIARDFLSLSNLKKLVTRLDQEYSKSIVTVRVYRSKKNIKKSPKKAKPSIFRLPGPARAGRQYPAILNLDVAGAH